MALRKDVLVRKQDRCRDLVNDAIHQLLIYVTGKEPTLKPAEGRRVKYGQPTIFICK